MFVIKAIEGGYYCGEYKLGGLKYPACGIHETSDPHVKKFKKYELAEKALSSLNSKYGKEYSFRIVRLSE